MQDRHVPDDLVVGPDGAVRCGWVSSLDDYRDYHDNEWGRPVHGDAALYERVVLEGFQSGLSWLTILRKCPAVRAAIADFAPESVAAFDEADITRLLGDVGFVRHRRKIEAAITNARATLRLLERDGSGGLDALVWSHRPGDPGPTPARLVDLPAQTPQSRALAHALKAEGFVFVGPTTAYATMQACGVVNDHLVGCDYRDRDEQ